MREARCGMAGEGDPGERKLQRRPEPLGARNAMDRQRAHYERATRKRLARGAARRLLLGGAAAALAALLANTGVELGTLLPLG